MPMNERDLKPAGQLASFYGVKSLVYGAPGVGKTPVINTAPRPVMLVCEPGLLSMRGSNVPAFEAYTAPKIREFFVWLHTSAEAKKYDTFCWDSISHGAEIILSEKLKLFSHGLKAYGEMATEINEIADKLYFMPQKHIYLVAKRALVAAKYQPFFPGNDLNIKIPHKYDDILYMALSQIPGMVAPTVCFRTKETFEFMARNRSGKLDEYEEPNLTKMFAKAMS